MAGGAVAFSVQGTDTPTTFDGGRTLGWELADQAGPLDAVYVQVGGGALATAVSMAIPDVAPHPVQAQGCAPLRRAWDAARPGLRPRSRRREPGRLHVAVVRSAQRWPTGILDDVTYDWLPLLTGTLRSGGEPIVAPESLIVKAYQLAHEYTDVPVCVTGTAGLAGLMHQPPPAGARVAVLFTGLDRT